MMQQLANFIVDHDPMMVIRRKHDTVRYIRWVWNKDHADPIDEDELRLFLCDEHRGDLTDEQKTLARRCRDEMRSVYSTAVLRMLLCNNAGINIPRLLVDEGHQYELDEAVWDKVMNVNLKGLFFCAQSAARVLVRQRHGVIVNMSSESGLEGSEGQSVYAASKNAVNSLTRSWAKELGKKGVRVVGVAPGILEATGLRTLSYETALAYTRGITVEQLRAGYAKTSTTPMGRSGKLSDVANVVAFMLSGRAGYVDGVTLNIAGGKTRG